MDRSWNEDENNQPLYLPLYVFNRTMVWILLAFWLILLSLIYCIYHEEYHDNNKIMHGGSIVVYTEDDRGHPYLDLSQTQLKERRLSLTKKQLDEREVTESDLPSDANLAKRLSTLQIKALEWHAQSHHLLEYIACSAHCPNIAFATKYNVLTNNRGKSGSIPKDSYSGKGAEIFGMDTSCDMKG